MTGVQPMPCPVLLGTMIGGGLPALLHRYTLEKKVSKLEKVLKKDVKVDCTNNLGQTPLFCASLLGFASIAEKLLEYGANPNQRCIDGSTPVHAAVFSCNPWLLSSLLDAGGDLRLHDDEGRTAKDWAKEGDKESNPKIFAFLTRCESQMQSLLQTNVSQDEHITRFSSKSLLSSPSMLKHLRPWAGIIHENKASYKGSLGDMRMRCFGHGKFSFVKPVMSAALTASVPLISDSELSQANDEPLNSFMSGSFARMTNYSWKTCRVTVKELQASGHEALQDLLIYEQEYCCQLSHPNLLLLMAVSMSADMNSTKLVYERVSVGSLYSLLHQRREEFPVLQLIDLLSVLLQVCEVLMFLHGRSLVLRGLSSHTVLIVEPGVAKVTGLGFIVPSTGACFYTPPPVPVPLSMINWAAPEVIKCRACTAKADLYSVCALLQEIFADEVPWSSTDPRLIKRSVEAGQALVVHPAVPEPYYQFLQTGLQHKAKDRTNSLHDLCYHLRCYIRSPNWISDIDQTREKDKSVHNETWQQENVCKDEEEFTTETDDPQSHECPIWVNHAPLSEPPCTSDTDKNLEISRSISKHTGSIVLNLKVSQVLLQQAEQSLDNMEAGLSGVPCFDEVDTVANNMEKESNISLGMALGPPSECYISNWSSKEDEVSQYSSAFGESFGTTSYPSSDQEERRTFEPRKQPLASYQPSNRAYMKAGLTERQKNRAQRFLEERYPTKPTWTAEVSEMVAQMTRGWLVKPEAEESSESEDLEETRLHLQDWKSHSSVTESEKSADLEQLFKSFAGIQSDSEESTNYHTINENVNSGLLDASSQTEEEECSEGSEDTRLEASTMFYTPKHHLANDTSPNNEHSESMSSEEELDITVEVCQARTSPTKGTQTGGNNVSVYHLAQDDLMPSELLTPVPSCLPDVDIADLSSISYSPARCQKWVESTEVPPIPQIRGLPTCNSTPRSPKGHGAHLQEAQDRTDQLPLLRSLMDTSPLGSAPSHTICTESYASASRGDSGSTNTSVSSVLQSPVIKEISKEDTESPSSTNAEFTTASSGARQTTENSQRNSEESQLPNEKKTDVAETGEEVRDKWSVSDQSQEEALDAEGISEGKEKCKPINASSTLDEDLQRMMLERGTRSPRAPGTLVPQVEIKGEGDVRDNSDSYIGDTESRNTLGEKTEENINR
ncbi:hypothetical protein DNTS_033427 [Danionella cerebrum]|uniref:Protein kinase domain-containing protein n=1 Tax=Danionella cerebrum TaxID=2873325 RepID=A0A553R903_9TELE|nr:hypothetical protein DNTS_033427 [Danionella translucida]TRY98671.1 hypothetical protein DNTS_033427 [Danionella translucida]